MHTPPPSQSATPHFVQTQTLSVQTLNPNSSATDAINNNSDPINHHSATLAPVSPPPHIINPINTNATIASSASSFIAASTHNVNPPNLEDIESLRSMIMQFPNEDQPEINDILDRLQNTVGNSQDAINTRPLVALLKEQARLYDHLGIFKEDNNLLDKITHYEAALTINRLETRYYSLSLWKEKNPAALNKERDYVREQVKELYNLYTFIHIREQSAPHLDVRSRKKLLKIANLILDLTDPKKPWGMSPTEE